MAISFDNSSAAAMQQALQGAALRQQVLSNNIANVNTPQFKRSDVVFGDQLQQALDKEDKKGAKRLALQTTNPRHLSPTAGASGPRVVRDDTVSMRTDGNNVDIDREMAEVAKNSIFYQANAQQLSRYYATLKSVITGGR